MRSPLAAWRAGVRWPLALIDGGRRAGRRRSSLCEAIGWPFLVGAGAAAARQGARSSRRLRRRGERRLGRSHRPDRQRARARPHSIEIGAPSWSATPHMLLATDARPEARLFRPLARLAAAARCTSRTWRRARSTAPRAPRRRPRLVAVRQQEDSRRRATSRRRCRPSAGCASATATCSTTTTCCRPASMRASRSATATRRTGAAASVPRSERMRRVAPSAAAPRASDAGIFIRAGGAAPARHRPSPKRSRLAPGESGLRLKAVGQLPQLPVRIDLRTAGVLGFLGDGKEARRRSRCRCARRSAAPSSPSTAARPIRCTSPASRAASTLAGPSLAAVGDALGITLPTTPAFKTHGTLAKDGDVWKAVFDSATIGSSRLDGAFTYDKRPKVPLLAGRLGGSRLLLADLGPAVGAPRRQRRRRQAEATRPAASFPTRSSTCRRCARWTRTS